MLAKEIIGCVIRKSGIQSGAGEKTNKIPEWMVRFTLERPVRRMSRDVRPLVKSQSVRISAINGPRDAGGPCIDLLACEGIVIEIIGDSVEIMQDRSAVCHF